MKTHNRVSNNVSAY